jgi:hypothetical protein
MDFHTPGEMIKDHRFPVQGFVGQVWWLPQEIVRLLEKVASLAGPLSLPVHWILVAMAWVFAVAIQSALGAVLVLIRLLSGKGEFGDNLMLMLIAVSPTVIASMYFGFPAVAQFYNSLLGR